MFRLARPCPNCPFRKEGAIELMPGRLEGIIDGLVRDDWSTFHCHETVHSAMGGEWDDDGNYTPSGQEAMCAGAVIYLEKAQLPTVGMRLGRAMGVYDPTKFTRYSDEIIEPYDVDEAASSTVSDGNDCPGTAGSCGMDPAAAASAPSVPATR